MSKKWVVNASPLIILAKVGQVSLLQGLCDELVIPSGVAEEVEKGREDDPARIWMREHGRRHVRHAGHIDPVIAGWDLGRGESEVLSWAYQHSGYEALVDDRVGRNCALSLNIRVRGTVGIILLAKHRQKLEQVSTILDRLCQEGYRITSNVIDAAKRLAGE